MKADCGEKWDVRFFEVDKLICHGSMDLMNTKIQSKIERLPRFS